MKRAALIVCLVLMLAGEAAAAPLSGPYWERIKVGQPNDVVIAAERWERFDELVNMAIRMPQLAGMTDQAFQEAINEEIRSLVQAYVHEVTAAAEELLEEVDEGFPYHFFPLELLVDYEVKYNKGGLLSLVLTSYEYLGGAHGMTHWEPFNLDLARGQRLKFADLFSDEQSRREMAAIIDAKVKEEPDWYFIDQFDADMFTELQPFYIVDGAVVAFFNLYEIAPYAAGIQEFTLSIE